MDTIQYERWKDFSTRMARHCFDRWTPRRIERLVSEVEWWFEKLDDLFEYDSHELERITCWESRFAFGCVCDYFSECFDGDHYHTHGDDYDSPKRNRFHGALACCIRAGLDMAAEPTGGVVGFTKGSIEQMYPEGVPNWITHPDPPWNTPWDQLGSDEGIWL